MKEKNESIGFYQQDNTGKIVQAWKVSDEVPKNTWVEWAFQAHELAWEKSDRWHCLELAVGQPPVWGEKGEFLVLNEGKFQVVGRYLFQLNYQIIKKGE